MARLVYAVHNTYLSDLETFVDTAYRFVLFLLWSNVVVTLVAKLFKIDEFLAISLLSIQALNQNLAPNSR